MSSPFNLYISRNETSSLNPQVNCFTQNNNSKQTKENTSMRYHSYSKEVYHNNNVPRPVSTSRNTPNKPDNKTQRLALACVDCTPVGAAPNIPLNNDTPGL